MPAKSRGLGRSLDSLLPKVDRGVQEVDLSRLKVSPFQPRKRIDPSSVAELAASIREKGVLQPLLVRPTDDGYEIVAGERRFRAAEKAGLSAVPVIVKDLDDRATLEIAVIENLQREDLNPVEEAQAFRQLLEFGLNQDGIAQAVGKSRSAVANTLRLLQLPPEGIHALETGKITAGHARAVLGQPEPDRLWALGQILDRELNVREAEDLKRSVPKPARSTSDGRYGQLESDLTRHLGSKVKVHGGKKGRIELHFFSEDELERLLELLGYRA